MFAFEVVVRQELADLSSGRLDTVVSGHLQLSLDVSESAFGECIVVAVVRAARATVHSSIARPGVLAAAVRVVDQARLRLPLLDSLMQHRQHEVFGHVVVEVPGDDPSGVPIHESGQAQYQVVPKQARFVKQMFEWVGIERVSIREVERRLRKQGVPTSKGLKWHAFTIRKLLTNPAYQGTAIFGRSRVGERRPARVRPARGMSEHPKNPSSRYATDPKDQIEIPVPALISPDLFQAVAEQLKENREKFRQQVESPGYLLQGLIECGCCGYTWYGKGITRITKNPKAPYPYYRCIGMDSFRFSGTKPCSYRPVRLDRLDTVIWNDVCTLLQNPQDLQQEFERRLGTDQEPDINLEQVQKQIQVVQRSISRLIDAYECGLLEKGEFEPRIAKARERLQRLQSESATATDHKSQREELRLVLSHLDDFASQVREGLDKANFATRKEIIRSLVKVIKIDEHNVRITYRMTPALLTKAPQGAIFGNIVTTVYSALIREIGQKGDASRFVKADKGLFGLKQ